MFQKLLAHFTHRVDLPIDVREIADFLIRSGCQDSIILHPERLDTGELRGAFVQYTTHPGVYAAPEFVTLIIYPENVTIPDQRVICAKELVHVCDGKSARTNTAEEVDAIIDKLLGPLSTDDYSIADLMASVDRIALYQGLALLFPMAARKVAREKIKVGQATEDDIAEWADLPSALVKLVLSDDWDEAMAIIREV